MILSVFTVIAENLCSPIRTQSGNKYLGIEEVSKSGFMTTFLFNPLEFDVAKTKWAEMRSVTLGERISLPEESREPFSFPALTAMEAAGWGGNHCQVWIPACAQWAKPSSQSTLNTWTGGEKHLSCVKSLWQGCLLPQQNLAHPD